MARTKATEDKPAAEEEEARKDAPGGQTWADFANRDRTKDKDDEG